MICFATIATSSPVPGRCADPRFPAPSRSPPCPVRRGPPGASGRCHQRPYSSPGVTDSTGRAPGGASGKSPNWSPGLRRIMAAMWGIRDIPGRRSFGQACGGRRPQWRRPVARAGLALEDLHVPLDRPLATPPRDGHLAVVLTRRDLGQALDLAIGRPRLLSRADGNAARRDAVDRRCLGLVALHLWRGHATGDGGVALWMPGRSPGAGGRQRLLLLRLSWPCTPASLVIWRSWQLGAQDWPGMA